MIADESSADWRSLTVAECLRKASPRKGPSIRQELYQKHGKFPVIDQGQEYIAGWTDAPESVISDDLPVIVFGDHTRAFKYVDFPFALGADGTKLLYPAAQFLDPEFFYFALLNLDVPNKGYNRHYRYLRELRVHFPANKAEQRAIAHILRAVQAAREARQREVNLERERKAALMAHLFTHGTRGEPTKQTPIGEMPVSWGVKTVGEVVKALQYGLSIRGEASGGYPMFRMNNLEDGYVVARDMQYVDLEDGEFRKFRLKTGDILFNRTNSADLVGKSGLFCLEGDYVFASSLVRLIPDAHGVMPEYLSHFLNWDASLQRLRQLATRGVSQSNISAGKLEGFLVAVPFIPEQQAIAATLHACDAKIAALERESALLDELFRALLEELMTGRVSVAGVDAADGSG